MYELLAHDGGNLSMENSKVIRRDVAVANQSGSHDSLDDVRTQTYGAAAQSGSSGSAASDSSRSASSDSSGETVRSDQSNKHDPSLLLDFPWNKVQTEEGAADKSSLRKALTDPRLTDREAEAVAVVLDNYTALRFMHRGHGNWSQGGVVREDLKIAAQYLQNPSARTEALVKERYLDSRSNRIGMLAATAVGVGAGVVAAIYQPWLVGAAAIGSPELLIGAVAATSTATAALEMSTGAHRGLANLNFYALQQRRLSNLREDFGMK